MLGLVDRDVSFANAETLGRMFVTQTLGFWVRAFELRLARLFGLPWNERIRFDIEAGLLRPDFKTRVDGLRSAVQGGIYTVNDARAVEGLSDVEHGDEILVQAQMEPLSRRVAEPAPPPAMEAPPVELPLDLDAEVEEDPEELERAVEAAKARMLRSAELGARAMRRADE
jgi:hypothetical protein